ncbi:sigma-54-dependent transcriptional regulator [Desulfosporosinus lacus]|uniref:Stage 0 sporulation protein A homolog n=1 Tax=Desulfosporosinus lacus DSM 15449 TaxID=1121420 RepID=A0A1M6GRC8_9FIRM|nr:sigma-54 dependent transcriptional regulator [Desulfosporosinus lacus]SHJ12493.1 Response regulator receiver domain-containing protein [Desulfosporosinus lacus DSM 15449]
MIKKHGPDLILTDIKMPKKDGLTVLREVQEFDKDIPVIVITGFATIESAIDAMKAGAYNYLPKPFTLDQFRLTVERAIDQIKLKEENRALKSQMQESNSHNTIGVSAPMKELYETICKVAKSEANVLILGESGTGKELTARSLHSNSPRSCRPFVAVDCVSLPDQLLESELFGHEKGAFTGAYASKPGLIELANTGTVFLDEIGDLSIGLQAKLLRVLQERQFRRLGGTSLINVDVRVIAATNRDLKGMLKEGTFREDLYYRLNVITLNLTPLRERFGDIPLLVRHFCRQFSISQGKVLGISPEAMQVLENYPWLNP